MTRNGTGKWALALSILVAIVALVTFAVRAESKAAAAVQQGQDQEIRLRTLEQVVPRIDEKLKNIEMMLREQRASERTRP